MELFLPLLIGFAAGVFVTYLMTPPEYRSALFARVHTTIDDLHQKIAASIARARDKKSQ
jgi:hypothetical protein